MFDWDMLVPRKCLHSTGRQEDRTGKHTVSDEAAKVPSDYAVPCCTKLDVEFLLDRHRDILIHRVKVSQHRRLFIYI